MLAAVLIKVPDEAKEAITRAIEASRKGQEEAIRQITELKKEVSELKQELENLKGELKDKEEEPKTSGDKKDEQTKAIDKLKTEIESLKKKVSEPKQQETKAEEKKEQPKNSIVNLPSGAVVEMGANGNIIRTIKEAPQQTYTAPAPTTQSQNQTTPPPVVSPVQTPQPTLTPTPSPSCTTDVWGCSDWSVCSSSGSQARTCNKTFECPLVVTPSPSTSQSCTPPTPSCQADTWSCGDWNSCSASGNQSRSCTKTFDCSSTNTPSPSTSQSCTPPAPTPTPTPPSNPVTTYSDYNFNYQWSSLALTSSKLTCPMTSRNIVIKKATLELAPNELQKLNALKDLEADGFMLSLKNPIIHAFTANEVRSGIYNLEGKTASTFVYFGGNIPVCSDGSSIVVSDLSGTFTDTSGRGINVKVYIAQKGIIMDVNSISNGVEFDLHVLPIMTEWEVWDYTTSKPVKIN
mgnify:CR=1 FL=1